jgi:fibronectin type 3 domain-containing protein
MTTDRISVKGAMTAEICRITVTAPTLKTPACTSTTRLPVQPGRTHAADELPPALTVDPPGLLAYRVQIFNSHGHSAGLSPDAFTAAGAAPPPVEQLRATPTRDGAMLEWQQKDTSAAVELDRLPVGPDGVVVEPPQRKAATKSSKPTIKKPAASQPKPAPASAPRPLQMTSPAPIEVKLRTPTQPADTGGTIDHTAKMGETYQYTAQRVRSVSLDGHTLESRSSVSLPATVAMRDTFPPHAPSGLEAVPGGATAADRSIDLSWTPDTDADLAGYFVYRQEVDPKDVVTGTVTRLNTTPVVGPAYRDQTALPGRRYAYRVTAVDTTGNESAPSPDVQETLREQ